MASRESEMASKEAELSTMKDALGELRELKSYFRYLPGVSQGDELPTMVTSPR